MIIHCTHCNCTFSPLFKVRCEFYFIVVIEDEDLDDVINNNNNNNNGPLPVPLSNEPS